MDQPLVSAQPSPPSKTRALLLRAAAAYALILIILFPRLFTGDVMSPAAVIGSLPPFHSNLSEVRLNENDHLMDIWMLYTPWEFEQFNHGPIPQWNPHIYCGFPVFSNGQSEFLNPTHWAYYFINPDIARGPMAALRLWVSASVLFILLCRWGLRPLAAFLGGAVWMLSAFNIRWLLWANTDSSLVLPILILALDCFLARPSPRRWALLSLAGLLLALSGHPGSQILVGLITLIFLLVRLPALRAAAVPWLSVGRRALACAAAATAALAAGAIAIFPLRSAILASYEYARGSRASWALPPDALWLFIAPNIYGWPRGDHPFTGPYQQYNVSCCWFGLVALALVLAATVTWCFQKKGRDPLFSNNGSRPFLCRPSFPPPWVGAFAILLTAISLPLAFGVPQLFSVYSHSTLGNRTSLNLMFFGVHFGAAILAALGAHQLFGPSPRLTARLAFLILLTALVCAFVLLFHTPQLHDLSTTHYRTWAAFWLDAPVRVLGGLLLGALACITLGTIAWSPRRASSLQSAASKSAIGNQQSAILSLLLIADLIWVAWGFNPIVPRRLVQPPLPPPLQNAITSAADGRITAINLLLAPNLATIYDFRDPRGCDLPRPFRLGNLLHELNLELNYLTLLPSTKVAPTMDPTIAAWLNRCSVRFLLSDSRADALPIAPLDAQAINRNSNPDPAPTLTAPTTSPPPQSPAPPPPGDPAAPWPCVTRLYGCSIFANPNAYPRAFIPAQALPATPDDALHALLDPATDLRRQTLYESSSALPPPPPPASRSYGTVQITRDDDGYVDLDVSSPTGGLVVLHDSTDPGWSATIDQSPAQPLIANYLFRAVQAPPGHHIVHWSYQTPHLSAYFVVSIVTILVLLCLVICGRKAPN